MAEKGRVGGNGSTRKPSLAGAGGPGYEVVEAARDTIARYDMAEPGDKVVVAVSGGPDSTCLLDVLQRLAPSMQLELLVGHVDHGLSGSSDEIASRVARLGALAGLDVHVARAKGLAGPNVHARAREFRYEFLEGLASQEGARRVATGHTLDDRAETTIARLIHGAAPEALAGIPPKSGMRIRPLLEVRRAEARAYCDARGLEYYDDPANDDPRFDRAEVRTRLVRAIEERWGDGAVRAIAASAERLREDSEALAVFLEAVYPTVATVHDGVVHLEREGLLKLPSALRRRVLQRAVGRLRDRSGGIQAALEALDAGASTGARFAVAGGIEIEFAKSEVIVRVSEDAAPGDGAERA